MASVLPSLLSDRRTATMFLPAVSFGYLYSSYQTLSICIDLGLNWSPVTLLVASLVSTVTGAILYGSRLNRDVIFNNDSWWANGLQMANLGLTLVSLVVLLLYLCSGDLVVVLLSILAIALLIITTTEQIIEQLTRT